MAIDADLLRIIHETDLAGAFGFAWIDGTVCQLPSGRCTSRATDCGPRSGRTWPQASTYVCPFDCCACAQNGSLNACSAGFDWPSG